MLNFYKNKLSFKVIHKFINKKKVYGYFLKVNKNQFIEIFNSNKKLKEGKINHYCFNCKSIKNLRYNLIKKRVQCSEIVRGRTDQTLQSYGYVLTDPNQQQTPTSAVNEVSIGEAGIGRGPKNKTGQTVKINDKCDK